MKKIILSVAVLAMLISNSSCGTICGGTISDCQKHKPASGSREIRPAALIGDILLFPVVSLIVDFCDGGVYKPCSATTKK